jgi:hypothetical protein
MWGAIFENDTAQGLIRYVGRLGYSSVPTSIDSNPSGFGGKTFISASASFSNAMILASDGTIFTIGSNSAYQV